ncbi:MAG TPA: hypothetical protein VLM85_33475, partial [Polyangiaceae bacterium]|nr:hypothetical protein [Polyangiaceae bacterium]
AVYPDDQARDKTLTVIFHLWVNVPKRAVALRDAAESLLLSNPGPGARLALHWGLGIATYPFFYDMADSAGHLLAMEHSVWLAELRRPLGARWGQGPTATRAAERIVNSWVDWGALRETDARGIYAGPRRVPLSGELASWMAEAVRIGRDAELPACGARAAPALFPFELRG